MDHMPAEPFDHFADLDYERRERCGFPEVIYASGKEPEQVRAIAERLLQAGAVVLATRVDEACARTVQQSIADAVWAPRAHLLFVDRRAATGAPRGIPTHALRTRVTDIAPLLSGGVGWWPVWRGPFLRWWQASWTFPSLPCPLAWDTAPTWAE